jgi:hypothetical protein
MEEQLNRKKEILKYTKELFESGKIKQSDIVELNQDMNRVNHNIKHIIRGNTNPAGRYSSLILGGFLGLCWVSSKYPRNTPLRYALIFSALPIAFSSYALWKFGVWKFSSEDDAKKNLDMYRESLSADYEFKKVVLSYEEKKLSM